MIFKKDNFRLGIVIGLLAPILAMFIYYFLNFTRNMSLAEYFFLLRKNKSLLTGVSSISLVANAIFFTLYINAHKDRTARGIFAATMAYGVIVLVYKLLA